MLDEVAALFPSRIIHIGGDEAGFAHWQNSAEVTAFMQEHNLPTCSDMQLWAINRMSAYLASKGVRMIGWNEITGDNIRNEAHVEASRSERLADGVIVQFWDGDISLVNKAIEKGYDVVNSNRLFTYLDYPYEAIPLEKAYSFDPRPEGLSDEAAERILGTGCQMWGERTPTREAVYGTRRCRALRLMPSAGGHRPSVRISAISAAAWRRCSSCGARRDISSRSRYIDRRPCMKKYPRSESPVGDIFYVYKLPCRLRGRPRGC